MPTLCTFLHPTDYCNPMQSRYVAVSTVILVSWRLADNPDWEQNIPAVLQLASQLVIMKVSNMFLLCTTVSEPCSDRNVVGHVDALCVLIASLGALSTSTGTGPPYSTDGTRDYVTYSRLDSTRLDSTRLSRLDSSQLSTRDQIRRYLARSFYFYPFCWLQEVSAETLSADLVFRAL